MAQSRNVSTKIDCLLDQWSLQLINSIRFEHVFEHMFITNCWRLSDFFISLDIWHVLSYDSTVFLLFEFLHEALLVWNVTGMLGMMFWRRLLSYLCYCVKWCCCCVSWCYVYVYILVISSDFMALVIASDVPITPRKDIRKQKEILWEKVRNLILMI